MRKFICGFLCTVVLLGACFTASAAITGDIKTYDAPFLITNAGQGPGGKMVRLLTT